MTTCPFCESEVDDHIIALGGQCPTCFGEIPGEEAPTDPGAMVRAQQEADDRRVVGRGWGRVIAALMVSGTILVVVIIAAVLLLRPKPVAAVLDFDDADFEMMEIELVAYTEPEPEPHPTPRPKPTGAHSASPDPSHQGDGVADATDGSIDQVVPSSTTPDDLDFGAIDVGVARRSQKGIRLTEDDAIIDMIKRVMGSGIPGLKTCYDRRLKVNDKLRGRWLLQFKVSREGQVIDVTAEGQDMSDPELETCLSGKVAEWEFSPIRAEQPVQKTLNFRPM